MSILCEHQHDFLLQMQVRRRRTGSGLAHFWECRLNALELPSGTADRPFRIIVLTANDRSLKPRRHVLGISILTWCELNLTADISIKSLRQCYSTEYTYTSNMVVVTIVARMTSLTPLYLYLLLYVRVDGELTSPSTQITIFIYTLMYTRLSYFWSQIEHTITSYGAPESAGCRSVETVQS